MPWTSLWWPGDHRAGDLLTSASLLEALVAVEQAWLDALVATGLAPASADLADVPLDPETLAVAAESGGNPVLGLVAALRAGTPEPASTWLHRGLTSQDVLDTAVVLGARAAVARIRDELDTQVARLVELAGTHRDDPCVARTLTQYAVPTTLGLRFATWLTGILDAAEALDEVVFPVQLGGAAGTLAGPVELAGPEGAQELRQRFAARLGLDVATPWHTSRRTITRIGDAAVSATDAWGRLANDVLLLGRPEVGELTETSGGGSSTMPDKANPTLAVLVRRAALTGPTAAATLHLAAAGQVDERADGAWHTEWETLATLLRRTVVAASQTTDLLAGLQVHADVAAARVGDSGDRLRAEQRALAEVAGRAPAPAYLGLAGPLVDEAIARAQHRPSSRPRTDSEETP